VNVRMGWDCNCLKIPFTFSHGTCRTMAALELLRIIPKDGNDMTRAQWLLLGAIGLGLAIVVYVVFFCPADCQ
jgi:hypothetical protein